MGSEQQTEQLMRFQPAWGEIFSNPAKKTAQLETLES